MWERGAMIWSVAAAITCAAGATIAPRLLAGFEPALAVRVTFTLMAGAALATLSWAALFVAIAVVDFARVDHDATILRTVISHGPVPVWLTAAAATVIGAASHRTALTVLRHRDEVRTWANGDALRIVESASCHAFAVDTARPTVVLTSGLVDLLDASEVRAVVAHEVSHLSHRHRDLRASARIATAMCPILVTANRELQHLLERWADEDAARSVSDRRVVATAIARTSLADPDCAPSALAFRSSSAQRRVEAMLAPQPSRSDAIESLATIGGGAVAVGVLGAALQLHHAVALVH